MISKDAPLFRAHHGPELMQIDDHQQLYAAEWRVTAPVAAQYGIDGVQQVGTNHADLVDHQEIEAFYNIDFFFAEPVLFRLRLGLAVRNKWAKRQLKEGVQGNATRVNGCHAGRGSDDHALWRVCFQIVEKRGLAGARLSRQENIVAGVTHKVVRELQFEI